MEESVAEALMGQIDRLENELQVLRKLVHESMSGGSVKGASLAVAKKVTQASVATLDEDRAETHPSGLEVTQGRFLEELFRATHITDDDERSERLGFLTHSSAMLGPRSVEYLRAFNWKQLVKNAASYLDNGDVGSFRVTRCEPSDPTASKVKIFLKPSDGRHPAPIVLERDAAKGGEWKISQLSL